MRQRMQPSTLVVALGAAMAFGWHAGARAQPTGATVVQGQARITQQGSNLRVVTGNAPGTQHSVIDWRSFSVPAGSTTRFVQPSAASTSINRVTGNDPSAIYGTLSSNGRLVLVNPAGITVGAGAVVDTAGFTASTLRMSDADALAGRQRFAGDSQAAALSIQGQVLARGGDVVLIAPRIDTGAQALIRADDGTITLAAGRKVEITGRGVEGIRLQVSAPGDRVLHLGTLQGDAVGIFAAQLQHSGLIRAQMVSINGSVLRLVGPLAAPGKDDKPDKPDKAGKDGKGPGQDDAGPGKDGKGAGKDDQAAGKTGKGDKGAAENDDKGPGNDKGPPGKQDKSAGKDDKAPDKGGKDAKGAGDAKDKGKTGAGANPGDAAGGADTSGNSVEPAQQDAPSAATGSGAPSQVPLPASPAATAAPLPTPVDSSAPAPAPPMEQLAARQLAASLVEVTAPALTPAALMDAGRRQERFAAAPAAPGEPRKKGEEQEATQTRQCTP